ncbi:hemolysin III family protein [Virgibacillus sp. MSJ-26]|uniref:PAQR family membrane homeostasis protein TrhA n=1 Tax=Virgibacillus sp. MSJ-26 TaxID=2841522 RepID=UPI001C0FFFE7|nr:hemolysin III family protein [Virgibacillus sp. MSJ-26]MBU5468410.1 hemolysin III family protein [Virgibacillus sp. MSJ-26]
MRETHIYTKNEEIAHAITHGIGALLSIAGLVLLIVFSSMKGNPWQIVSVTIFGVTMLLMYLCSTIVHSLPDGKWKNIFQIFDHSSIYLFIAGTYTPFLLVHLRGTVGWTLFGVIWGIAIIGIVFKVFFVKRFLFLSTLFYILMGWLIVIVWEPLTLIMDGSGIRLLVLGGIFYTVGCIFYVWRSFPYHHAVWHLFVLAGSAFHFFSILHYVII